MGKKGKLFLIPTPLGGIDLLDVIPEGVLRIVANLTCFFVEEFRSGRRYLSAAGHKGRVDNLSLFLLNEHTKEDQLTTYIEILEGGTDAGLLSEAGIPAVADPGSNLVALAHKRGIEVVPMSGPSSIILALAGSGKSGQNFEFHGYLPIKSDMRKKTLKRLESNSLNNNISQIFIETPYRNNSMLSDILDVCHPDTTLTIAAEITLPNSFIVTKTVWEWRKALPDLNKKPCVFIL